MPGAEEETWFVGDLGDPWVAEIAAKLPASARRRDCRGDLPESWMLDEPAPATLVLHRPFLNPTDTIRLARLRARGETTTRVILCLGPHSRHDELVRSSRLFDVVLPEATASETIRRHLDATPTPTPTLGRRSPLQVVSGLHDIRLVLSEVCRHAGFVPTLCSDTPDLRPRGLVLWDAPVLNARWPDRLAELARSATVIGLFGFADRAIVATARRAGASACLDWPCDLDDLTYVLDRMASIAGADLAHVVPPLPIMTRRGGGVEVADRRQSS